MTPSQLAFRKQLLLVKGDALRMQMRMELGIVRQRWNGAGFLFRALHLGRKLGVLFGQQDTSSRGWRSWLKTSTRLILAWQSLSKAWR